MTYTLSDDECVYALGDDKFPVCVRTDEHHWRELIPLGRTLCQPEERTTFGPCRHTHQLPVESTVTGDVVAWLCPHCDTQLIA